MKLIKKKNVPPSPTFEVIKENIIIFDFNESHMVIMIIYTFNPKRRELSRGKHVYRKSHFSLKDFDDVFIILLLYKPFVNLKYYKNLEIGLQKEF